MWNFNSQKFLVVFVSSVFTVRGYFAFRHVTVLPNHWHLAFSTEEHGNCVGPQMKLMSDDPRRTCTEIFASKNTIEYSCTSLIKGFPKAMIRYCPVEVCLKNGTWSRPSISCAWELEQVYEQNRMKYRHLVMTGEQLAFSLIMTTSVLNSTCRGVSVNNSVSECYEEGKSRAYVGHRMCTKSGLACQAWAAQHPHRHRFRQSELFPDYSIHLAEAFCRDPGGSKGAPWCFTKDLKEKWEFCDIKRCSDITMLDGSCGQKQQEMDKVKEETENVEGEPGLEGKLSTLDDVKKRFESADPMQTCSGGPQFEMEKGYRIRGKVLLENKKRSVLECAFQCSKMPLCRYFSFRGADGMCTLAGREQYVVIRNIGFKTGVKLCHF